MRRGTGLVAIAPMVLAACATTGTAGTAPVAIEGDAIRYETGPCYGTCPVYAVTITPDGRGTFEGRRFTAVTGERTFTATPADYTRLAASLARWRPREGTVRYAPGEANCRNAPTDNPSVEVTWSRAIGDSQTLSFYYGCARENPALAEALRAVPGTLPIAALVGGD